MSHIQQTSLTWDWANDFLAKHPNHTAYILRDFKEVIKDGEAWTNWRIATVAFVAAAMLATVICAILILSSSTRPIVDILELVTKSVSILLTGSLIIGVTSYKIHQIWKHKKQIQEDKKIEGSPFLASLLAQSIRKAEYCLNPAPIIISPEDSCWVRWGDKATQWMIRMQNRCDRAAVSQERREAIRNEREAAIQAFIYDAKILLGNPDTALSSED